MNRWLPIVATFVFAPLPVRAQNAAFEPPKLGQPIEFSHVVGVFRIAAVVQPTTAAIEEPLTLTVSITGQAIDPHVPKRDRLHIFPDGFSRDFFVEPIDEETQADAWTFRYRLRPKHARVQFVPSLKLVYYAPRQRRYQTAYTDAVPLAVTPRSAPAIVVEGLKIVHAPPGFFELADERGGPADGVLEMPAWTWFAIVLGLPGAALLGEAWRRRRKASSAVRRRQRHRVAEPILAALAKAQDAGMTAQLLNDYLRLRLNFPAQEPTPTEVERWLKRLSVAVPLRRRWRQMLQEVDAVRYAPKHAADHAQAIAGAAALIEAMEEQPCLA